MDGHKSNRREDVLSVVLALMTILVSAVIYSLASPAWQNWLVTWLR